MSRRLCLLVPLSLFAALVSVPFAVGADDADAAAGPVELVRDGSMIRVVVKGEYFATMQTDDRFAKPFLYPVMQPGWSRQPPRLGRYITIKPTTARLATERDGRLDLLIPSLTTLTVNAIDDGTATVVGASIGVADGGRVPLEALVPLRHLAVREIRDDAMPYQRKNPAVYEHPHHKGIWIAIDRVAETAFWNEDGVIDVVSADLLQPSGDPAVLRINARWMIGTQDDDLTNDEVVLNQSTLWGFHPDGFITTETVFSAPDDRPATFGDTKEGLLGYRMPDDRREKTTGLIRNADGAVGEGEAWGRPSDWVDYIGPPRGETTPATADAAMPGVSLFAHPSNDRKSRYHVRGYGLFSINPFGANAYSEGAVEADPLTLGPGESVRLRYGVWVHGAANPDDVAAKYREYAATR